jgi:hypothetical protein
MLVVGFAATLAACSGGDDGTADSPRVSGVAHIEGAARLPSTTLEDWASYADHVVLGSLLSEREVVRAGDINAAGEGLSARSVTVSIERFLWSRQSAPALGTQFSFEQDGWLVKDFQKQPFTTGDIQMVVGHRYLMVLTRYPEGWGILGSAAFAEIKDDGTLLTQARTTNAAIQSFRGASASDIQATLSRGIPDPEAAKHFDLDPIARYAAVVASGR